jgi:hypothetical protein
MTDPAPTPLDRARTWAPRVLAVLFAAFLSIFALDVFTEGHGFAETLVDLAKHLVPSAIVVAVLLASWRRAWIGAAVFPLLGLAYVVTAWGRFHWSAYVAIAGPMFVLGVLYAAAARGRRRTPSVG